MARSFGNLWPQVVSWENLLAAYQKCRRRKRYKRGAVEFDFSWESNLLELRQELMDGSYRPGPYRNFHITDPKPRLISAAPFRDRVVHHAVVRVLEPIYERRFIIDSYACLRGKGTHRAIRRTQHYLRRYKYFLKTDIVRFFPNVDHFVLLDTICRQVQDRRLLGLVASIIATGVGVLADEATDAFFRGDDLFALLRPKGMPIGNLTSQFFANVLLDQVDHFVKEELRVPGYVRYADDLVLFGDDKQLLWQWRDQLRDRLAVLRLRLHVKKTQVRPCRAKLKFLGMVICPDGRRLQQQALARFNRRLRHLRWGWRRGSTESKEIRQSLLATVAYARFGNSRGGLRDIWRRVKFVTSKC